jgi:hypothetical protein
VSGETVYAYVQGNPVSYVDRDGETPVEAAIGAGIGAGFGLVTGLIEGKRGYDLFENILEDAGFGAMTGLTDGLNLVAKV